MNKRQIRKVKGFIKNCCYSITGGILLGTLFILAEMFL